jgi:hypothetical protein
VRDRVRNNTHGIYNGFMVCAPRDERLLNCIDHIVHNVRTRYYGATILSITGPQALNKFVDPFGTDVDLAYDSKTVNHRFIKPLQSKNKLLVSYPQYNAEQKKHQLMPHYGDLWRKDQVYLFGRLPTGLHLNFIEIGTSDFNTCIQEATEDSWGLSIEPIAMYLRNLPDKRGVRKLQQAVSDHNGTMDIYYVPADKLAQHNLPRWVRGSNSVNKPHPLVLKEVTKRGIPDPLSVFTTDTVRVTDPATLLHEQGVTTVHYLKVDAEGHDCTILRSWHQAAKTNKAWFPRKIMFESNQLTPKAEVNAVCALFETSGYRVKKGKNNTELFRKW